MATPYDVSRTTLEDLENALSIDEDALDENLEQHPDAFYRVAKKLAMVISLRDAAKQEKEEIEARIDAKIRHDAEVKEEKITEKQIESMKRTNKEIGNASIKLTNLNAQVGRLSALKDAFTERRHALVKLSDLYVSGYFGATTSGATNRAKDRRADDIRKKYNKERRGRS